MYDFEDEYQKTDRTVVNICVIGLAIGTLLVWVFSGPPPEEKPVQATDGSIRAEDVCIEQGGIPIIGEKGNLTDCKKL
jgi:hypothetical protein